MFERIATKLNIAFDGQWSQTEIIAAVAGFVVAAVIIFFAVKIIVSVINKKKSPYGTIFSHGKNKYKDRIGKKVKY